MCKILGNRKKNCQQADMLDDNRLQFLVDEPAELELDDAFGHKEYAQVMYDVIRDAPQTPFCIGVFGAWGTGKSGIKDHLKKFISQHKEAFACVDFDVWLFSQDNIQRALLDHILDELDLRKRIEEQFPNYAYGIQEMSKIAPLTFKGLKSQWPALLCAAVLLWIGIALSGAVRLSNWFDQALSTLGVTGILSASFVLIRVLFSGNVLREDITNSKTRTQYNAAKDFKRVFEGAMALIRKDGAQKRCVILIDNLDRCPQSEVESVLSGIKTFFSDKTCVYVVFCDDEALRGRLEKSSTPEPSEYLRKIFNTTLRVSEPLQRDILHYCDDLLRKAGLQGQERLSDTIVTAFATNPRRAKQLINRLVTAAELARRYESSERLSRGLVTNNLAFLAKLLVLEEDYHSFWELLHSYYYALDELTRYAQHGDSGVENDEKADYLVDFRSDGLLLDFLRDTSWVTSTHVVEFLSLQQSVIHPKVSDVYGLKRALYAGTLADFKHRVAQAIDDDYERELLDICLEEMKTLRSAAKWGLLNNAVNRLMAAFSILKEENKRLVAKAIAGILADSSATPIIRELDPGNLLDALEFVDLSDCHVLLDKMYNELRQEDASNSLVIALSKHVGLLAPRDPARISSSISENLDQNFAWLASILRTIASNADSSKELVVEPLHSRLLEQVLNGDFDQMIDRFEIVAIFWSTGSDASKQKFASDLLAVVAANPGAIQSSNGERVAQVLNTLQGEKIDNNVFNGGISEAIVKCSEFVRSSGISNEPVMRMLLGFGEQLGTDGANELAHHVSFIQEAQILAVSLQLSRGPYQNADRAAIVRALAGRSLSLNMGAAGLNAVFDALAESDEEKALIDDMLDQLLAGADASSFQIGLEIWNNWYPKSNQDFPDRLATAIVGLLANTDDPMCRQRSDFLTSQLLGLTSEPTRRAVMDKFHNLLISGCDVGRVGLVNGYDQFTNNQVESEAALLATTLIARAPSTQDNLLVDVILHYRDRASSPTLRNLCTYAAQALGIDDPLVADIGHRILNTLGRIYAANINTYLHTHLVERVSTASGDKRTRLMQTLEKLREKHVDAKVWPEVDALRQSQ